MKQRLYLLALLAFSFALTSCEKDDEPAPVPEVVGTWYLDYGLLSGFSNSSINGSKIDPYSEVSWADFFYTSKIHVLDNANKTFVEVFKSGGLAEDLVGTWTYEGSSLVLDYNEADIDNETFTFQTTNGLNELISSPTDLRLDSATVGKIQYVYRK